MTLVEFLRARLDDDERIARDARPGYFTLEVLSQFSAVGDMAHVVKHGPVRVLAEVEAKRRIVDGIADADPHSAYITGTFTAWDVLHLLALPHADHPDYDPAWRV